MVRNRQHKTSKGLSLEYDMEAAVEMVMDGNSLRQEGGAASLGKEAASLGEGSAANHTVIGVLDPEAGPSHALLSPEDFRGYPKAGERKTDRNQRKKRKKLNRLPVLGDYVWIELKLRSQSKFYVGQITKMEDDGEDYEVKFPRYQKCNTFVEPLVDDLAAVNDKGINMLLENPSVVQGTKRQKGFIPFKVDFGNLTIG
ncbi:hypothetical protein JTB14_013847 [Gonioctena quinquepunctata]|nr:hypothetical protein JTB14_013847 [Gonioctena quinquepunctata]